MCAAVNGRACTTLLTERIYGNSPCEHFCCQIFCGVMACPPEPGDESYELYHKERSAIFEGMKRRARLLTAALNDIPGPCPAVLCVSPSSLCCAIPHCVCRPLAAPAARLAPLHSLEGGHPRPRWSCARLRGQSLLFSGSSALRSCIPLRRS